MNQINKYSPLRQKRLEGEIFVNTNDYIDNFPVGKCIYIKNNNKNGSNCSDFDRQYRFKHIETGNIIDVPTLYGFESTGIFHNQAIYTNKTFVKNTLNKILVNQDNGNIRILDETDLKKKDFFEYTMKSIDSYIMIWESIELSIKKYFNNNIVIIEKAQIILDKNMRLFKYTEDIIFNTVEDLFKEIKNKKYTL